MDYEDPSLVLFVRYMLEKSDNRAELANRREDYFAGFAEWKERMIKKHEFDYIDESPEVRVEDLQKTALEMESMLVAPLVGSMAANEVLKFTGIFKPLQQTFTYTARPFKLPITNAATTPFH